MSLETLLSLVSAAAFFNENMHFLSFVYVTLSVEQDSGLSSMEWVSFTSLVSGPNLIAHLQHWLLATI